MNQKIAIHFFGEAGVVTGSKYLIETGQNKFLVDCGLFQGLKELRNLNWENLPVDASSIDFILLTHGHLDHVGYLPKLVNAGFKGKIFGSAPTLDIAAIVLRDSARLQEEDADHANKHGYSKHKPALPLYTVKDAEKAISFFTEIAIDDWTDFGNEIKVRYQKNGHIIGSCFIEVHIGSKKLVFSGDVGQEKDLLLDPPKRPQEADVLFIESTYGDRLHPHENIQDRLKGIILDAIKKGGNIIIPSFAVERTQTLMYMIWQLRKAGEIPEIPCFMDSPMGANVLNVFHKYREWHNIPEADYIAMCKLFRIVKDHKETFEVIKLGFPKIIIAGSGMVTGGRVLSYLEAYISKPETTVMFVGYQAQGTKGRKILEGTHEIKLFGHYCQIKAHKEVIHGLSAHGDQQDLLNWLSEIKNTPEKVFIIHGEKQASETFEEKLKDTFHWEAAVPKLFDTVELEY